MVVENFFSIAYSDMGLGPLSISLVVIFGLLFLLSFGLSSKNMDAKGVLGWMLEKPDGWVGKRK